MMERHEILNWLREPDPAALDALWLRADAARRQHVGNAVHLRGLVEISNHCVRQCAYCGLRAPNAQLTRYRMTADEVLACVRHAVAFGYGTVVLQAGEDPQITQSWMSDLIRRIKSESPLAVTLSLGERQPDDLAAWREAGADRYLLRFETSNPALYERIHPSRPGDPPDRLALLGVLGQLGYEVGSGVMIGIPGQTYDDLANDLALFGALALEMIGVGPFLPHPNTPLGAGENCHPHPAAPWHGETVDQVPNSELMTYKVVALARLLCPDANIPSTTALATLNRANGRELGLLRGANVIMPNLTPTAYRRLYEIYPAKACLYETAEQCHNCMMSRIQALGRTVGTGRGDAPRRRLRVVYESTRSQGSTMSNLSEMTLSETARDFVDEAVLNDLLTQPPPDRVRVRDLIAKSLSKTALTVAETAALLTTADPELHEEIFAAARQLKRDVYGNRIVLFAPLYVGNDCVNDCLYCAFRRSNRDEVRRTLTGDEIRQQVEALENQGHKRLILVFGEHPRYSPEFLCECIQTVYGVKVGHGEIRRVNVNAAPFDVAGFRQIKAARIGTFQIFQETYQHATFAAMHPRHTRKGNYLYRLDALSRAQEAGIDDVGIGALFGLYDWRFEVLGLISHALHLQAHYGVGPHTISFPRLRPASGVRLPERWQVSDHEFKRLVAILRLAVPYTGLILTAREPAALRRELMAFGVSQIDAGTRLELGGYTEAGDAQCMEREQFELGDIRSLDEVTRELINDGYIPSFCTACYRLGRTGEHFMEFAIPGFIKKFCTPNALSTALEYLVDYASPETRAAGEKLIAAEVAKIEEGALKQELQDRLERIRTTEQRDLYF